MMPKFIDGSNAVVVGSHGGIGNALVTRLNENRHFNKIFCLSRQTTESDSTKLVHMPCDITDTDSIESCRDQISDQVEQVDLFFIATGILHNARVEPEKRMEDLSMLNMQEVFLVNTIAPILLAKTFAPLMNKEYPAVLAALSARVGSIADNRLGGWYSYRASKSALNMFLRTFSIEMKRKNPGLIVTLLHPGTTDTKLSKPFQKNVPAAKLFPAERSAAYLLEVVNSLTPADSGNFYAWDGRNIEW
ncbi:MAG: SDR family NAD(P)-dependent oxidoreductase [Gammaproteobacteria bacterium]|nr:SDR family NAD(P)-dependent oxidoreductase [Gammaproteobacteria bacterium]